MAGQPFMMLFVADLQTDAGYKRCTAFGKALWMQALCEMHTQGTYEVTGSVLEFSQALGLPVDHVEAGINEIERHNVADVERDNSGTVHLLSRRRLRESKEREYERNKKRRQRLAKKQKQQSPDCPPNVPLSVYDSDSVSDSKKRIGECEGKGEDGFEEAWNLYSKKIEKAPARKRWRRLSKANRKAVMNHLPGYIRATPEKRYRLKFWKYLENEKWKDEEPESDTRDNAKRTRTARQQASLSLEEQLLEGGYGDLLGEGPLGDEGGLLEDRREGGVQSGIDPKQIPQRSGCGIHGGAAVDS